MSARARPSHPDPEAQLDLFEAATTLVPGTTNDRAHGRVRDIASRVAAAVPIPDATERKAFEAQLGRLFDGIEYHDAHFYNGECVGCLRDDRKYNAFERSVYPLDALDSPLIADSAADLIACAVQTWKSYASSRDGCLPTVEWARDVIGALLEASNVNTIQLICDDPELMRELYSMEPTVLVRGLAARPMWPPLPEDHPEIIWPFLTQDGAGELDHLLDTFDALQQAVGQDAVRLSRHLAALVDALPDVWQRLVDHEPAEPQQMATRMELMAALAQPRFYPTLTANCRSPDARRALILRLGAGAGTESVRECVQT